MDRKKQINQIGDTQHTQNKDKTKVVLFRRDNSLISKAIAHVTGSEITHSAVLFNGALFDASEYRGDFARANIRKLKNRIVEVYPVGASEQQTYQWLIELSGKKYDYKGIAGWLIYWFLGRWFNSKKLNSRKRVYCFEATAMLIAKVCQLRFPMHISGEHLRQVLGQPQYIGPIDELKL